MLDVIREAQALSEINSFEQVIKGIDGHSLKLRTDLEKWTCKCALLLGVFFEKLYTKIKLDQKLQASLDQQRLHKFFDLKGRLISISTLLSNSKVKYAEVALILQDLCVQSRAWLTCSGIQSADIEAKILGSVEQEMQNSLLAASRQSVHKELLDYKI